MDTHNSKGKTQLVATATPLTALAGYLGNRLGRIVVDKTGLNDEFDFTLEWAPDDAQDSASPSLITALREQRGLRLESQQSPVQVLVIDSISRPTEN